MTRPAVPLRIYDSATRSVREFVPLRAGRVSIYVCGATVQAPPHLGHLRGAVAFDILRRWLAHRSYQVTFIRNVTDIDDKILERAARAGQPWWAWAALQERRFREAYEAIGCLPATYEPRATGHITDMIELTRRLIDTRHAYRSSGDVYFSVSSSPEYGSLSGQDTTATRQDRIAAAGTGKRAAADFALWKRPKRGEPGNASWPTPWGPARPGWHLECSAMSTRYLGSAFDIHGGGRDLIFPHHENELAQSRAAGDAFAGYWLHNGLVTVGADKMSKSQTNAVLVADVIKRWRPVELRYFLGSAHYRSTVEFSAGALAEAAAAYARVERFVIRARDALGSQLAAPARPARLPGAFTAALCDDLGVPAALGIIQSTVRRGNVALDVDDRSALHEALNDTLCMTRILGISPDQWAGTGANDLEPVVAGLVQIALDQRAAARARKDFATADAIRSRLAEAGIAVHDSERESRWELSIPAHEWRGERHGIRR
jgi:cysteinyl-tRNA synthetase